MRVTHGAPSFASRSIQEGAEDEQSSEEITDGIFLMVDEDGSGEIDKKEFRKAIRAMGFNFFADDSEIDMVFDDFDIDKSGKIDYKELNKALRRGASMKLDSSLQPGSSGTIETKALNRASSTKERKGSAKG